MIFLPFGLRYAYLKPVYATGALLLICIGVYVLAILGQVNPERWGLMRDGGQPERLVTHVLIHGGWLHLAVNMAGFIVFAQIVNAAVGSWMFLLVCGATTFSSSALELALDERLHVIPAVGLSGVIAGLTLIGCLWLPKVKVRFVVWIVFMFGFAEFTAWTVGATWLVSDLFSALFTDWRADHTSYWGHLGGFAGGLLCYGIMRMFQVAELSGFLVEPLDEKSRRRFIRRLRILKTSAPEADETTYRVMTCLRCGHEALLTEAIDEKKPLKCLGCGRTSRTIRSRNDGALKSRRRKCMAALGGVTVALFALSWFLMKGLPATPTAFGS